MTQLYSDYNKTSVELQIGRWSNISTNIHGVNDTISHITQEKNSVYKFFIDGKNVKFEKKRSDTDSIAPGTKSAFDQRAESYQRMLNAAVAHRGLNLSITMAIDVEDLAKEIDYFPVFSFQKERGTANILLPDLEMEMYKYFPPYSCKAAPYDAKTNIAQFFGSTTGSSIITEEDAREAITPRLSAYRYFRNRPEVDFKLLSIVQCASPKVEQMLKDQGMGGARRFLDDGFDTKFLISLDGNGAACSRPLFALHSTSVLLKYDSPYVLYWTDTMIPNLHFMPIGEHADVVKIVRTEMERPGAYRFVAEAGRTFAESNLCKVQILDYVALLLERYAELIGGGTRASSTLRNVPPPATDVPFATEVEVSNAYRICLGRDANDPGARSYIGTITVQDLYRHLTGSVEYRIRDQRRAAGSYLQYAAAFDVEQTVMLHQCHDLAAVENRAVTFQGAVLPASGSPGVHGVPIPHDFFSDVAHYAAVLHAIDKAQEAFRMVQVNCGRGEWLAVAGVAARSKGLRARLIGLAADADAVQTAQVVLEENGLSDLATVLACGVDALAEILVSRDSVSIDLLHVEATNAEVSFLTAKVAHIDRCVKRIVVSARSRCVQARIHSALDSRGWELEVDRPVIMHVVPGHFEVRAVGIQSWVNKSLHVEN